MSDDDKLPTMLDWLSQWLGVQLPSISLPQTLKNLDRAVGKVILAGGENLEAHIKAHTAKTKAHGKIEAEGIFRTEEDRRKMENRASAMKAALEDLRAKPNLEDAKEDIDDDWLNLFVRVSEDKSTEELQHLFGRVLSGEIQRPRSFSLRTVQLLSTISKSDAEMLSGMLSYVLERGVVPFDPGPGEAVPASNRLFLEEVGAAGHPSHIGGMSISITVNADQKRLIPGTLFGIIVQNNSNQPVQVSIHGQILTKSGTELLAIANPPPTDLEFLKRIAQNIAVQLKGRYAADVQSGAIQVHVCSFQDVGGHMAKITPLHKAGD